MIRGQLSLQVWKIKLLIFIILLLIHTDENTKQYINFIDNILFKCLNYI